MNHRLPFSSKHHARSPRTPVCRVRQVSVPLNPGSPSIAQIEEAQPNMNRSLFHGISAVMDSLGLPMKRFTPAMAEISAGSVSSAANRQSFGRPAADIYHSPSPLVVVCRACTIRLRNELM